MPSIRTIGLLICLGCADTPEDGSLSGRDAAEEPISDTATRPVSIEPTEAESTNATHYMIYEEPMDDRIPTTGDSVIIEPDQCQGELCSKISRMAVKQTVAARVADSERSAIEFTLTPSDTVEVVTWNLHHRPPGLAVVTQAFEADGNRTLQAGDTVRVLGYVGEEVYTIVWRDSVYQMRDFWSEGGRTSRQRIYGRELRAANTDSWVKVRNTHAKQGWIMYNSAVLEVLDM